MQDDKIKNEIAISLYYALDDVEMDNPQIKIAVDSIYDLFCKYKKKKIIETAERIAIDYANLSGRETANRSEFRERVLKHLNNL